jgi:hypothetical protein
MGSRKSCTPSVPEQTEIPLTREDVRGDITNIGPLKPIIRTGAR